MNITYIIVYYKRWESKLLIMYISTLKKDDIYILRIG